MILPQPVVWGGIRMFLRRFERRKNGKVNTYWALVESYRTAKGSRQRLVAYLGELKPGEQSGWAQLGQDLDGKPPPAATLFDPSAEAAAAVDDAVWGRAAWRSHGAVARVW